MSWTFDDNFDQEDIDAILGVLDKFRGLPDGGFINGMVIGIHIQAEDDDYHAQRFVGDMRKLVGIGLLESMKLDYIASFDVDDP